MKAGSILGSLCLVLALASASSSAHAGGLYFSDRGVRPLGRAGAFVAGADDLGAIAYNPAGIYDAGGQFLIDGSALLFSSSYTRQAIVTQFDPNTGQPIGRFQQTFPEVQGSSPFIPIPTLAISFQPHPQWVLAFGLWAPYAPIATYPETASDGSPAPQRYSLINFKGSSLAIVDLSAAFAPSKQFRLGISLQALVGTFDFEGDLTACLPERFVCAYEEPSWDVLTEVKNGPIFAPSGNVGAIYIPDPAWRVGAAFQLPFYVRAPATIETRLPSAALFENATQDGDKASVAFDLPWSLRAGVETRAVKDLRVELAFEFTRWSMFDKIQLTPNGISLDDVATFPPKYYLPPVSLVKNFRDTGSVKLGGEYSFDAAGQRLDVRGGLAYESSAIPHGYLSVQTLDLAKVTASIGASVHVKDFRFDLLFSHVQGIGESLDPKDAQIAQVYPLAANAPKNPDYVNGGVYSARAEVIGLGLAYTFAAPPKEYQNASSPAPPNAPGSKSE